MRPDDLLKTWDTPDHSQLTRKQISLRLPIQVSAKISALCEMYPRKTKTEIIGDLLATALEQLQNGLPSGNEAFIGLDENDEPTFENFGLRDRFWMLTKKYLKELQTEIEDGKTSNL